MRLVLEQAAKVLANDAAGRSQFVHSGGLAAVQQLAEAPGSKLKVRTPAVAGAAAGARRPQAAVPALAPPRSGWSRSRHPQPARTAPAPPTLQPPPGSRGGHQQRLPGGDRALLQPRVQPAAAGEARRRRGDDDGGAGGRVIPAGRAGRGARGLLAALARTRVLAGGRLLWRAETDAWTGLPATGARLGGRSRGEARARLGALKNVNVYSGALTRHRMRIRPRRGAPPKPNPSRPPPCCASRSTSS